MPILRVSATGSGVLYDPSNLPKDCVFTGGFEGTVIPSDFERMATSIKRIVGIFRLF